MGPFISAFFVLFLILYFKSSSILEIIEAVYLFVESHYERHRDFEKIDDFTDVRLMCELKGSESSPKFLVRNSCRLQGFVLRCLLRLINAMDVD